MESNSSDKTESELQKGAAGEAKELGEWVVNEVYAVESC